VVLPNLAEWIRQILNLDQLTSEIVAAIVILALTVVVSWLCYSLFERFFKKWAGKTKTQLDDTILQNVKAPIILLAFIVGTYFSLGLLSLLVPYSEILAAAFTIAVTLVVTLVAIRVANILISWYAERSARNGREVNNHILFVLKKVIQAIVYIFAFLAILVIFKIDLTSVIVGFGIGGIAVALALQNVLSDALSAFSIYFDKPFEIGDFIVVGDYSGTVTKIGMKSTRVQLLQGEELILSNRELTASSVRNFKKLEKRRIVFVVRAAYNTPLEKLKKIRKLIEEIIDKIESAQLDMIHFKEIGNSSFDFEVVYYMQTPDYSKYLDTQEKINFAIVEAFQREGIEMPFPTQTVFLNSSRHGLNS
jgi:small-conductance mechanosensitive channel